MQNILLCRIMSYSHISLFTVRGKGIPLFVCVRVYGRSRNDMLTKWGIFVETSMNIVSFKRPNLCIRVFNSPSVILQTWRL
jgi:hypothetical protein